MGCAAAPVLIAVSASSNPLPLTSWLVYGLPIGITGTLFGDQPGLGADSNTIAVTFNDFDCSLSFIGSEVDILQKTDLEHNTGTQADDFFEGTNFAPQPVQSFGSISAQYVVTNDSDCAPSVCTNPFVEVDVFLGTPEGGGVTTGTSVFPPMTPTLVDASGFLPPADQPSPGPQLQTNDDRFLNAVWENGEIWTADGTTCQPSGVGDCLDYVEIGADNVGNVSSTLTNQFNNVGVSGADLFYPAVTLDAAGNMLTVFDESSTSLDPSILAADVPSGGSALSSFQLLHTSPTYYKGTDLFANACELRRVSLGRLLRCGP